MKKIKQDMGSHSKIKRGGRLYCFQFKRKFLDLLMRWMIRFWQLAILVECESWGKPLTQQLMALMKTQFQILDLASRVHQKEGATMTYASHQPQSNKELFDLCGGLTNAVALFESARKKKVGADSRVCLMTLIQRLIEQVLMGSGSKLPSELDPYWVGFRFDL